MLSEERRQIHSRRGSSTASGVVLCSITEVASMNRWGWRTDIEAAGAYCLGAITAIPILLFETKNNFVRFHAYVSSVYVVPMIDFGEDLHRYQSLMLSCALAIIHLIFIWSRFFSWVIFLADIGIFAYLA